MIITISRETGSGGHTIGQMLAGKLNYAFYDKEIVAEVAKKMNIDETVIFENGETMSDSTYLDLASGFVPFSRKEKIPFDKIKTVQDAVIEQIAAKDNCIIVGRGANNILRDLPNAFHVFIHANMEHRIGRVQKHQNISGQEECIRHELEVKDRSRSMYYSYFCGEEWGKVGGYNLSIDTSVFSKTQAVDLIISALRMIQEER